MVFVSTLALLSATSWPVPDERGEALLDVLQERAVRFFWEQSHPTTGLSKDRAVNFATADEFEVSSCASTGFALAAYVIGVERGWLSRAEARARTLRTLIGMRDVHEHHEGWFYHFVDWETGERVWESEASTIDTSIFLAGLVVAQEYWGDAEITRVSREITERINWGYMLTDNGARPDEVFFTHGYKPETGFIEHRWARYSEEMMIYLQAFGFSDVTTEGWNQIARPHEEYEGLEFLTGGPLFIHQMSHVWYDFKNQRDELGYDYWIATRNATLANRLYAINNPEGFAAYGENFWGLSASDSPDGYSAFGAPGWINDNGTITPTSVLAALQWTRDYSLAFADHMLDEHPQAWGRYGWSNSLNPHRDWVGPDVIGIDLGMMLLGIENERTGLIHRLSMRNRNIRQGFERAGFRPFPTDPEGPLRMTD